MEYRYIPKGVCSRAIDIELDGEIIKNVTFYGGCNGNLKAISKLIKGKNANDIIAILEGNTCGHKKTSCADQLTKGLRQGLEAQKK